MHYLWRIQAFFNIAEVLEQILFFLAIDKSLCRLWYRCGAPILWKCIKLKGNDSHRSRLKKFMRRSQKPVYNSNLTHLEISHYHPLSDKKINSIVRFVSKYNSL